MNQVKANSSDAVQIMFCWSENEVPKWDDFGRSWTTSPTTVVHRLKTRKSVLTDEIALAKTTAIDPTSAASVYAELVKLAEKKAGCLVQVFEESIKYRVGAKYHLFDLRLLRKRMARAAEKKSIN